MYELSKKKHIIYEIMNMNRCVIENWNYIRWNLEMSNIGIDSIKTIDDNNNEI